MVFCKFPSCITGPTGNVEMRSDYVDFEGELVVVIGKEAKQIAEEDALNYVAGFCIGQDISDRPANSPRLLPNSISVSHSIPMARLAQFWYLPMRSIQIPT